MPDTNPPTQPAVRYEKSDAHIGGIVAFGIALAVLGVVVDGVALGLFDYLKESESRKYQRLSPLAAKERSQLPGDLTKIPEPRLQTTETADLDKLRRHEESLLTTYGWADRKKGIVHIPINEAMDLLANPQTAKAHGIRVRPSKGGKK